MCQLYGPTVNSTLLHFAPGPATDIKTAVNQLRRHLFNPVYLVY